MLLITAPSKSQQPIDRMHPHFTLPHFLKQSDELISILRNFSVEKLCKLMKMSSALGESTSERIQAFETPFTLDNCRQSIFTFQGDAYQGLTPELYSEEELQYAQNHVRILSGLYGILRPLDLMMPYRLEMGAKLKTEQFQNLYQFWGDMITERINEELADHTEATLINLASTEYSRVVKKNLCEAQIITITFKEKKSDGYKTIPIHSKRARGMMIHYAITSGITLAAELKKFTLANYSYAEELSEENNWIFTRDV